MMKLKIFWLGCLVLLAVNPLLAQNAPPQNPPPSELSVVIGERQIKFTPLKIYQEMKLEIFNSTGELIYVSGPVAEADLRWNLHDSNGQPLAPGLYAYSLLLKTPETETPRRHQGHLIIEQGADRLWLTTKDADGVGTEVTGGQLTVVRSPERTTAGAGYVASGRSLSERAGLQRNAAGRTVTDKKNSVTREDGGATLNISGSGTTNRITKWLNGPGEVVGDSALSEVGGNVGLGTVAPDRLFVVQGAIPGGLGTLSTIRTTGSSNGFGLQLDATGTGNNNLGMAVGGVAKASFAWDNARNFFGVANLVYSFNDFALRVNNDGSLTYHDGISSTERFRVTAAGNVGIGTASPDVRLEVVGSSGVGTIFTTTFGSDNVIVGRSAGGSANAPGVTPNGRSLLLLAGRGHNGAGFTLNRAIMNMEASENWTNTAAGTRILFSTTANGTIVTSERMRIEHNGRVGIGTSTPASTLDVNGIVGAVTQYNLGGTRMLSVPGTTNLFVGENAGNTGLTGFSNVAVGQEAGQSITDGDRNSFFGRSAGQSTDGGNHNSFFGHTSGRGNILGDENTFFGYQSGLNNDFGNNNAFFGTGTGLTNTTGDNNTLLGHSANVNSNNLDHATAIGAGAIALTSNQIQLGRNGSDTVRVGTFAAGGDQHVCYAILVPTLSDCSSSRRYKENIQPLRSGLQMIQRLRPVTFDWIGRRAPSLGLIAEEVAAVEPRLVTHNSSGVVEGVKYDQITAVLIKAVKEQQAQIASLKKLVCRQHAKATACRPARQTKR